MNSPYGPYGQGAPWQQPGPPQAYPPPGYAPPGYPQPGYPYPPPQPAPPSGVTAIIAIVLAGLGGVANFFGGLLMAFSLAVIMADSTAAGSSAVNDSAWTPLVAISVLNILCGVLLLTGTVMLLRRKMTGRWIVIAGCATNLLSTIVALTLVPSSIGEYEYNRSAGPDAVGLIFAIATVVLVLLPSTAAWLQARRPSTVR
ncbi:hypothetical protein [Mycolicibacterium smegmatis]|uniref:hypothetical protein n=1 Tax=Mycolicibacterium smegmatis TaxID=1772 RepID=UPI001303D3D8|nr:hypothetical protein [Mycolicibacterium smegmatis]